MSKYKNLKIHMSIAEVFYFYLYERYPLRDNFLLTNIELDCGEWTYSRYIIHYIYIVPINNNK